MFFSAHIGQIILMYIITSMSYGYKLLSMLFSKIMALVISIIIFPIFLETPFYSWE